MPGSIGSYIVEKDLANGEERLPTGELRRVLSDGWNPVRYRPLGEPGMDDPLTRIDFTPQDDSRSYIDEERRLVWVNAKRTDRWVLLEQVGPQGAAPGVHQPDGRYLVAHTGNWEEDSWHLFDVETRSEITLPPAHWTGFEWTHAEDPFVAFTMSAEPGSSRAHQRLFVGPSGAERIELEVTGRVRCAGAGALVVHTSDALYLLDRGGAVVEQLLPRARKEQ